MSSVWPHKAESGEERPRAGKASLALEEDFSSSGGVGAPKAGDPLDATVVQLRLLHISFCACNL